MQKYLTYLQTEHIKGILHKAKVEFSKGMKNLLKIFLNSELI